MKITLLTGRLAVCRLDPDAAMPAAAGTFWSATRTPRELSIVCEESAAPAGAQCEAGWVAFELEGPIPFETTGVLAGLAGAIARAGISLFALSTYDTDYALVKAERAQEAARALERAGYQVV